MKISSFEEVKSNQLTYDLSESLHSWFFFQSIDLQKMEKELKIALPAKTPNLNPKLKLFYSLVNGIRNLTIYFRFAAINNP